MPESVTKTPTSPVKSPSKNDKIKEAEGKMNNDTDSPKRRTLGRTARAKVELLDGSIMDLDVERKIRGHELLERVCDSLNLVEKDYFGLLFEDRGDPRAWIELEKRVSKQIKNEPWKVEFAVKFYPPEPGQLQEELTRYQLVLAIRKDIIESRLPCSSVTHALLASYLLQSELGDYEPSEHGAGNCKKLGLIPAEECTPEIEEKVVELHKTHRSQTPAEAELNYLENAKKLAMYGVDLHHARDSEGVDIMLGVCSSGLLVYREKLRINRFAWPKILKISYKRHNFFVKLRPGEFEEYESTVGFKLANHRAAKKLWKTCVEHHTFFRLMSPEPSNRSTLFPRLGSKFRYSGRTHYESKRAPVTRPAPHFNRTLSNRKLSSRSMDGLAQKADTLPADATKRHTMPPQPASRPSTAAKKPPPGAVKVMPVPEKQNKETSPKPNENGRDTTNGEAIDTTPKKSKAGGFGLFGKREKSPKESPEKEKSPKEKKSPVKDKKSPSKEKVAVLDTSLEKSADKSPTKSDKSADKPGYTKPYNYTEAEQKSPTRKPFIQGAFSYEKEPVAGAKQSSPEDSQSPTYRKATGLAFNYAPGEDKKVVESAEKRRTADSHDPRLKTPGIDYVQSAALKEQAKAGKDDLSAALIEAEKRQAEAFVPSVIPVAAGKPAGKEIKVVTITSKYNPKNKKLDDANGVVSVVKGIVDPQNGKITTDTELIDPKAGDVQYTNPSTNKKELKTGAVDAKNNTILFTTDVSDPKTGRLDPALGQQYHFCDKYSDAVGAIQGKEVDIVSVIGKYDNKHKKLDPAHIEVSRGVVDKTGKIHTSYGVIDPVSGKIVHTDPKTNKQEIKQAYVDHKTGNYLVTAGVVDPKSGKIDSSLGQQISVVEKDAKKANREVRLVVVTGKVDPKTKKLDIAHAYVDSVSAVLNGNDGKIYSEYGVIDPRSGNIVYTDKNTGKQDVKIAVVDHKTGNLILESGVVDPRTGNSDPSLLQQYSIVDKPTDSFAHVPGREVQLVVITHKYDGKTKKLENANGHIETSRGILSGEDGKIHTNFGIIDTSTGKIKYTDPKSGKVESKTGHVDPVTGHLLVTSGVIDPRTGKTDSSLGQQWCIVDKIASKPVERHLNLVVITTKYEPKSKKLDGANAIVDTVPASIGADGKIHTKYGNIDLETGDISGVDPVTGKEVVKRGQVDHKTGNILLNNGVVDPRTGQIDNTLGQLYTIVARPSDRFGAVKGKEVEVVSVISKVDGKNKKLEHPNGHVEVSRGVVDNDGKVHTNFGVIDPKTGKIQNADAKTGKIETKQANVDPKNGSLLLTSGVVDPKSGKPDSSLGQQFTVVDKDAPKIERYVRLIIITTKYDPKTKKLDATQAQIDTISGSVASDGKLHTSVGIIDPKTGDIAVTDPKTGKQELKKTHFDPHTGNFVVTSHVVDPKTGKEDPNLAIQYSIVDKSVPRSKPQLAALGEVQLVVITGKLDPKTKQLDSSAANVDSFKGYVSGEDGKVHTDNYILDPKSGQILYKDPFTGKQELKQAQKDPKSGNYSVSGILDPKTGKVDNSIVQQFTIVDKSNLIAKTITPLSSPKAPSPSPAITQTPLSRSAPPPPVIVSSPKPPVIPSKTPPPTPVVETTPLVTSMQKSLIPATSEAPKKRLVKIMIIFTKLDPKTKKPDLPNAEVEHITGILDPSNGQIETKYGTLDSTKGNMIITDPATGQKQTKDGVVIKETNQVFINTGAIDPKTGKIDPNLGMLVSVARQEDPVIEITTITGPVDVHGQVKVREGVVEHTKGKVDAETGHISTKYGVIDPSNGVIFVSEVSGVQDTKPIKINENTGHVTIVGVADPKTGKVDPNLGQVIVVGSHIDPVVEVTTFLGKIDSKKGIIEPKNSVIESSTGQLNPENNIIDTKYGQIDLVKGTVTYNDPKTGKFESKEVKVDPVTGQILLKSGQINPKSGKPDKDIGRQISLRITQNKIDPVSGKQIVENDPKNIKIDPKTNQMWTAGPKDPVSGEIIYTTGQIDPKAGYIVTIYGKIDPKTGNIVRTTEIDMSIIKVDPVNGQIYTATGQYDANNQPLYSASQVDPSTGEIYTKLGRIDPKTGRLVIVRIFVVTQKDDKGRVKEVDPKDCTIDESTGRIVTTKTVYVYQIVDPITGETIEVDPDDPRLKGARTTVTQTMTLSGKIDPVTGRIKTEYGDIDPDTGDIDPSTAVRDPVTGQLLLHYSQIDPSHFNDKSSNYTIEKETQDLPASIDIERINRTKHSTFDKNSEEPKTFTEYTTSEHIMHHGYVSSVSPTSKIPVSQRKGSKSPSTPPPPATQAPVVVKTTTKQVLTKNEDGVTHNVEEEVENLQTGEVTFSTQTNKADLEESTTGKSPYVSARAVTTRTATTHEDLGTNAKTQQLEEKTVAHTLTSSAHRHEQRVVTQEVKTTSTVTTGDQRVRHDSESSFSSGDSGTPIDLDDVQEPGHYTGTKTSTLTGTVPTGSMSKSDKERSVEGHPDGSETLTEGEIVSSQTISSKTRTVETITYKTEKDGVVETRVEQKITIQSDGDPIDHDRALAEAIKEATEMNPDMMIEKIEIQQQSAQQQ